MIQLAPRSSSSRSSRLARALGAVFAASLAATLVVGALGLAGCDEPLGKVIDEIRDHHGNGSGGSTGQGGSTGEPTNPCAAILCAVGTRCEVKQVQCIKAPCPPVAECVPDPASDPCAAVRCAAGTHCEVKQVQCVQAPCPPIATCVADAPKGPACGGFAGRPCPGSGTCVDDPSDSCDPNNGGADCGGICSCIAKIACKAGQTFDPSPNVCACVPAVTCGPVCDIYCQYGNVLDAKGCPTCRCNPAPTK